MLVEDRNFLHKFEIYRNICGADRPPDPDCKTGRCATCTKCRARYEAIIRKANEGNEHG